MSSRPGSPSSKGCVSQSARFTAELALFANGIVRVAPREAADGNRRSKSRVSENLEISMAALAAVHHRGVSLDGVGPRVDRAIPRPPESHARRGSR